MSSVKEYLNKVLMNETLRDGIITNFFKIEALLSAECCEIIGQLKIDLDLIEVLDGQCFSISQRKFIPCPISEDQIGAVSPRMFFSYDSTATPEAKYFKQSIENSFPDDEIKATFLNKFYQCLMAGKMPHKCRKLVVCGPKDSGKTTWASLFLAVIDRTYIASLTKEKTFSSMMINEDTQLVFLDEWTSDTLQSDTAKTVLQGGHMIKSVKHGPPVAVNNRAPFYITTNDVPYFGEDDESVRRRIKVFNTQSLPTTVMNVDLWLQEHAIECIAWMASEIDRLIEHVDVDERWYEPKPPPVENAVMLTGNLTKREMCLLNTEKLVGLTYNEITAEKPFSQDKAEMHSGEQDQSQVIHRKYSEKAKKLIDKRRDELQEEERREEELQPWINLDHIESTQDKEHSNCPVNSEEYHRMVNKQLRCEFNLSLRPAILHSFRMKNKHFHDKRCPFLDAWYLVTGEIKEDFDFITFFRRHPEALLQVELIRDKLGGIRLFADHDPVSISRKRFLRDEQNKEQELTETQERKSFFNFFQTWWTKKS